MFVAKPSDGSKVKLPPVTVTTEEENREYLLAAERRRMRLKKNRTLSWVLHTSVYYIFQECLTLLSYYALLGENN